MNIHFIEEEKTVTGNIKRYSASRVKGTFLMSSAMVLMPNGTPKLVHILLSVFLCVCLVSLCLFCVPF